MSKQKSPPKHGCDDDGVDLGLPVELDCPDRVVQVFPRICALTRADAEQKGKDAVAGLFKCKKGCNLTINAIGTISHPRIPCLLPDPDGDPFRMGSEFMVKVIIRCD